MTAPTQRDTEEVVCENCGLVFQQLKETVPSEFYKKSCPRCSLLTHNQQAPAVRDDAA